MADKIPTMYQISYREMILMRIELIGMGLAFGMFVILKIAEAELFNAILPFDISDGGHRVVIYNLSWQLLFIGFWFVILTHRRFKRIKHRADNPDPT